MDDDALLADDLITPLLRLLQALRAACGGDLEVNIILLAVAERTAAHPDFRNLSDAERMASDGRPFPTLGVNVRSIADSTGMPRETVRRKVSALLHSGWFTQTPQGLTFTAKAYRALAPGREEIVQLALRCHDLVDQHRARTREA